MECRRCGGYGHWKADCKGRRSRYCHSDEHSARLQRGALCVERQITFTGPFRGRRFLMRRRPEWELENRRRGRQKCRAKWRGAPPSAIYNGPGAPVLKIMEYLFELIQSSHTFVVLVLLIFEGICNTVTVQKQFYGFEISQTLHTWRFLVNW